MFSKLLILNLGLLLSVLASAQEYPFENLKDISERLNFSKYYSMTPTKKVSVAIFDTGFKGYQEEIGKTLPADTVFHKGSMPQNFSDDPHGLGMAQIVVGLMTDEGRHPEHTPELHLYNTFGISNLESAIKDVTERKIDVVLFAHVWEFGNNWDGNGFINKIISDATSKGILFINAAGNFGRTTYNSAIQTLDNDQVVLPDAHNALEFMCNNPKGPNAEETPCPVKIVLTWNSFYDDRTMGTNKDLDLILYRLEGDVLERVSSSEFRQVSTRTGQGPQETLYARELIQENLKPGKYFIRVKNISKNFVDSSKLRITLSGPSVELKTFDASESILNPADHPKVITVGASDSDRTSFSRRMGKPEIFAPSLLTFRPHNRYGNSGEVFIRDTSTASAIVCAGAALVKEQQPGLLKTQMLAVISEKIENQQTLIPHGHEPVSAQRAQIEEVSLIALPQRLHGMIMPYLERGARLFATPEGIKLAVNMHPFELLRQYLRSQGMRRLPSRPNREDDRYLVSVLGMHTRQREISPNQENGIFHITINEGPSRGARVEAIEVMGMPELNAPTTPDHPQRERNQSRIESAPLLPMQARFKL